MRGFQLLLIVALLAGGLHCARTAAPPADAPETAPESPEPPPADQQTPPQAPGPTPPLPPPPPPPPRRRGSPHRRPPAPPKQDPGPPAAPNQDPAPPDQKDPAPPRLVVPPQDPAGVAAPASPGMINRTTGCTTLLVLGDSTVDPGNNNHLPTTARANFLPYGVNFYGRRPTGRFTNGRLATDMLAEKLGISRIIPGFFDPNLRLAQLRRGVSFASGGSGYDDSTANRINVMSFSAQLRNLFRYKLLIRTLLGPRRAERLVNRAAFVISSGTNDLLSVYLATNRSNAISMELYENHLIAHVANYTQAMIMLGGRRFIFVGLPPMGCLPIARTLVGTGSDRCDETLNQLATSFNSKLIQLLNFINFQHQIRTSYIDTYTTIHSATVNPNAFGITEVSRGCCGSGVIEVGQTCRGRRTCGDPSKYLYWDAVHPTETTNQVIATAMMDSIRELYS